MKFINIAFYILVSALFFSCSYDSKTVAQYKYGTITKRDLVHRAQGIKLNPHIERTMIETICIEGTALRDALAAGYDKNKTYLFRVERETGSALKKFINEKTRKELNLSWDYVRCRHVAFNGGGTINTRNNALYKADRMIEALGKGAGFDSLTKSYSSDPQNAVAKSTIFVVKGGGRPDFEEAVFILPLGTYSKEPLVLPNGTAVVFISDEKGILTPDNLEKQITNPDEQRRLSGMMERAADLQVIAELEKNNSASFRIRELPDNDSTVLFTVSGKDYTLAEMLKRRDLFSAVIREPLDDKSFLLGFAREWYFSELYKAEAERKGYMKDEKLAAEMKANADFILANDYMRYICEKEITVSEKDMLAEYTSNKNRYMKRAELKTKKPVQLSYADAKVFIKKNLVQARVEAAVEAWKKKALAESALLIKG